MTLEEVKDSLYDTVEKYFEAGTVIWAEHGNTVPLRPYMTMKMNAVSRAVFPIEEEETSLRQRAYQCSSILEINLYTEGKAVTADEGVTAGCINTAVSGLSRFSNYMESEYITDLLADQGIAVSLITPVKDLSFLENENTWLYRAMAEYSVSFVMEADGAYGISCFEVQPDNGSTEKPDSGGNHGGETGSGDGDDTGMDGSGDAGSSGNEENTGTSDSGDGGGTPGFGSGTGTDGTDSGNTGTLKEQDFSDGGTKELAGTLIGTIEEVEMTGEYEA
ncbi:hypothetical protein C823_005223 [Eubacterium plexicaudatum ASF492]|uniref:Phage neck terminator protein gp12-like domain-containing protein n=1 Tax=Eubacterium plexicaudatum ASF492 TaxID=1235802 RepID=N2AZG9_9FIRM|nr:hypothetical protein C823_005223 [Eubacterium plexicaudatum ASF492]